MMPLASVLPQIKLARLERLIVMDCGSDDAPELWQMINPEIIWSSEETTKLEEGVYQSQDIMPKSSDLLLSKHALLDIDGQPQEMEAAVCYRLASNMKLII